jgi:hypothetical protein
MNVWPGRRNWRKKSDPRHFDLHDRRFYRYLAWSDFLCIKPGAAHPAAEKKIVANRIRVDFKAAS